MQFPKYSKKVIYLEDRKQQKKDAKDLEKQARIQQNYHNAHTLAQMLVAQPVCNKICNQVFPSWYRVKAKIMKRNWEDIREFSPFFADNKLDLWERRCSCGDSKCHEYMADQILIRPSAKLDITPNPQLVFAYGLEEEFEYHFDGDDPVEIDNEWKYPKVRR